MCKKIIVFSIMCFCSTFLFAINALELGTNGSTVVEGNVELCELEDSFTIEQVLNLGEWSRAQSSSFKVSDDGKALWLKFVLHDTTKVKKYLVALSPNVDIFEVYIDKSLIGRSGDELRFSERNVKDAYPSVIIPHSEEFQEIVVKLTMSEDFIIPLFLKTENGYHNAYVQRQLRMGLYIGVMLSICLYNLFLFCSTRFRLFLLYAIYVLFVALTQLSIFSDISAYLYPESEFWLKRDVFVFSSLLGLAIGPFILKFLSVKIYSLAMYITVLILTSCYGILFVVSVFLTPLSHIAILSSVNLISAFFLLGLSIWLIKKEALAKFFLIAWSTFLIGSIIFILENLRVIGSYTISSSLMTIGTAMEAILLSFALGHHFNSLVKSNKEKEDTIEAQNTQIDKLDIELTKSKLSYLRGRMNPHFLFNALTSIQNFILKNDKFVSADFVAKYASVIRENFIQTENSHVSLLNEQRSLEKYLRIERLKSDGLFTYNVDFHSDEIDINRLFVPPLLVQPLVENAVKHAFIGLNYSGIISVKLAVDLGLNIASVVVKDNGRGMGENNKKNHLSRGISIVQERLSMLEKLYENHFVGLEVNKEVQRGYEVCINLPLINKYEDKNSNSR